jgi:integrase
MSESEHKKQEPKLVKVVGTNEYFVTTKYDDLGKGKLISHNKTPATNKDLEIAGIEVKHRTPKRLPVFVSEKDLLEILKVSKHKHHKFAYMMGFYSGLRISEILNLEPRDIDMEKGIILVRQGKGSKDGIAILPKLFRKEMFELMPLKKLLKARALQKAFKKDCEIAGITKTKPTIHFHSLRHGFCTHAVEKGIDITRVQVLARHSNISTTNVYTHLNPKIALAEFREKF